MTFAESTNRFAVVTGASGGLGYELAKSCARAGCDLLIASEEPEIFAAADCLREFGVMVQEIQVDLSTVEGVDELCRAANGRPIDFLLANAGQWMGKGFLDQDWDNIRHVIDTQVTGPAYLLHKIGNQMRMRRSGRILVTGAIAGFMPATSPSLALLALRSELKGSGVTVTCLLPGETELFHRADVAKAAFDAMTLGDSDIVSGWQTTPRPVTTPVTQHA